MPDPIDRLTLERDRLRDDCAVAVALAEALIAENVSLRAERDRLRDAIAAIPRHEPETDIDGVTFCRDCFNPVGPLPPWPCPHPTEQAHRLIAAVQPQGLSDGDHAAGPNTEGSCGEGPHDGHVAAQAGPEGTLPAAKDCPPGTCPSCDEDRLKDSGPPRCLP